MNRTGKWCMVFVDDQTHDYYADYLRDFDGCFVEEGGDYYYCCGW